MIKDSTEHILSKNRRASGVLQQDTEDALLNVSHKDDFLFLLLKGYQEKKICQTKSYIRKVRGRIDLLQIKHHIWYNSVFVSPMINAMALFCIL